MPLTRGARHRLPAGEFRDGDLILDLPQPYSPSLNVNTLTRIETSKEDDETRYLRFRRHFEQEYGPGKVKIKDKDDFMPLEEGQILVGRVYGYYEVKHWPRADEQLKKSKTILARLKDEESETSDSSSELDASDDEAADETFAGNDDFPLLPPSAARTIEDDVEEEDASPLLRRTPASTLLQISNSQHSAPELGEFTPAQLSQQRRQSQKDAKISHTSLSQQRESRFSVTSSRQNSQVPGPSSHGSRIPPPNAQVPPPQKANNAALTVLARLDQRRQEDIENGFVSPNTHRQYTKAERMHVVGPEIMNERRQSWPRNMLKKKRSRPGDEDGSEYGDQDSSKRVVKKPKRKTGPSQRTKCLGLPAQKTVSPTVPPPLRSQQQVAAPPQGNVYPPFPPGILPDPGLIWPVVSEFQSLLPTGYQVKVRFVSDAPTVLSNYVQSQANSVNAAIITLEDSLVYTLLSSNEGQGWGSERCRVSARTSILEKLELFETRWKDMTERCGVRFTLPDPGINEKDGVKGFYTIPRGKEALKKTRGKQSGGNRRVEADNDSSPQPQASPQYELAPVPSNADTTSDPDPDFTTRPLFLATLSPLVNRQSLYLLETIRFQTAIPCALRLSRPSDSYFGGVSAQRKQYEANMRLAALSWQVDFFESWARKVHRSLVKGVCGGGLRFWKWKVANQDWVVSSNGKGKWLAIDFLTGLKGRVDEQWTPPNPRVYGEQELSEILSMAEHWKRKIMEVSNRQHKADLREFAWEKALKSAGVGNSSVGYKLDDHVEESPSTTAIRQAQEFDLADEDERRRILHMQMGMQLPANQSFSQYPSMTHMDRYQYEMMLQQNSDLRGDKGPPLPPRRILNYEHVDPRLLVRPHSMPMSSSMGLQMGSNPSNYGLGATYNDPKLQATSHHPYQHDHYQQRAWQQTQQQQTNHSYAPIDSRMYRRTFSHLSQFSIQQHQTHQPQRQGQYSYQDQSQYAPRFDSGPGFGYRYGYGHLTSIDPSFMSNINRAINPNSYLRSRQEQYDGSTNFPAQEPRLRTTDPGDAMRDYMGPSPPLSPTTLPPPPLANGDKGKGKAISELTAGLRNDAEVELELNQTPHGTACVQKSSSSPQAQSQAIAAPAGSTQLQNHAETQGTRQNEGYAEEESEGQRMFFPSSPPNSSHSIVATRKESLSPMTVRRSGLADVFDDGVGVTNTTTTTPTATMTANIKVTAGVGNGIAGIASRIAKVRAGGRYFDEKGNGEEAVEAEDDDRVNTGDGRKYGVATVVGSDVTEVENKTDTGKLLTDGDRDKDVIAGASADHIRTPFRPSRTTADAVSHDSEDDAENDSEHDSDNNSEYGSDDDPDTDTQKDPKKKTDHDSSNKTSPYFKFVPSSDLHHQHHSVRARTSARGELDLQHSPGTSSFRMTSEEQVEAPDVKVAEVHGDFATNVLRATGEELEEAVKRGRGDGWHAFLENLH